MSPDVSLIYDDSTPSLRRYAAAIDATLARLVAASAVERLADRDASLWNPDPETQVKIRDRLGWLDLPTSADTAAIESWAAGVGASGAHDVLIVGTGGMSETARLWHDTPLSQTSALQTHVLDSIDPVYVATTLAQVDPRRAVALLVAPHELSVAFEALSRVVAARLTTGSDPRQRLFALAASGSQADSWLRSSGATILPASPDIGERWSALSRTGLMTAAVTGIDRAGLIEGAGAMRRLCMSRDMRVNIGFRLGATLGALAQRGHDLLTFLATPDLEPLARWMRMLLVASLSKHRRGFVPIMDQRTVRLVESPVRVILRGHSDTFRRPLDADAPALTFTVNDAASLGAAMMAWQVGVAVAAMILGLNPFDQPDSDAFDHALRRRLASGTPSDTTHARAIAAHELRGLLAESRWVMLADYRTTPDRAAKPDESPARAGKAALCVARPFHDLAWATQALHAGRADAPVLVSWGALYRDVSVPGMSWSLAELGQARLALDLAALARAERPAFRIDPDR